MDEIKKDLEKMSNMIEVVNTLKMLMTTEYANLYSISIKKKFATDLITRGKLEVWHEEMILLKEMIKLIESI